MEVLQVEAGWYEDPEDLFPFRWFDGSEWTDSVANAFQSWNDPGGQSLLPPPPPMEATLLRGQAAGGPTRSAATSEGSISNKPFSKADPSATLIAIVLILTLAVFVAAMVSHSMNEQADVIQRTERLLRDGP